MLLYCDVHKAVCCCIVMYIRLYAVVCKFTCLLSHDDVYRNVDQMLTTVYRLEKVYVE